MSFQEDYLKYAKEIIEEFPDHNIILFGRPGAGKGTLAQVLSELCFVHVGVGTLIRQHINMETSFSKRLMHEMGSQLILPNDLADDLILPELSKAINTDKLFALDNYPVTLTQFNKFMKYLEGHKAPLTILHLDVSEEEATRRLRLRRTCIHCHLPYPPNIEKCKICKAQLETRYDDNPKLINERQRLFNELTEPLLVKLQKSFSVKVISS